jgi:hypothetical protein
MPQARTRPAGAHALVMDYADFIFDQAATWDAYPGIPA